MLTILFKILSILGIVLLILLGIALVVILLVLFFPISYKAAGKTGSAQYDSSDNVHSWFVGFAPSNHPKLVVSIVVEGAGTGGKYAVPIAKKMFREYLSK